MKQMRKNVFETNSSSTHSLTMCSATEYDLWQSGKVYLNKNGGYNSNSIYKDKQFVTREEAIDILTDSKYPPSENLNTLDNEDLEEYLRDEEIYTYDIYFDEEYLETYERNYTTASGDTVVAFGKYGYDG